jgi:hypothetical protein
MERFFLKKLFKRVVDEKFKIDDGIDVEVQANLGFIYLDWQGPSNPTTLQDESRGTFEELIG